MAIWNRRWCSLKTLVCEMVGQIPSYSKYYCHHYQRIFIYCCSPHKPHATDVLKKIVEKFTFYYSPVTIRLLLFIRYYSPVTIHNTVHFEFCLFEGGCPLSFSSEFSCLRTSSFRASVAAIAKIMLFCHTKSLLYYFTISFYNIPFIRCFIFLPLHLNIIS